MTRTSRFRGTLGALGLVVAAFGVASHSAAQDRLSGTVLKNGTAVPGASVALHRVTPASAGVAATTATGPQGGFSFRLPPPDTAGFTVYFATAEYQGVRYFGPPLHPSEQPGSYTVEVYDTTGTPAAGRVGLARRDVVLIPQPDGGWEVNEVLQLSNPERRTFVSGFGMPTWEYRLPDGVAAFEVGEAEISPDEVQRMGSRVLITSPLPPGTRDLFLRYRLPATAALRFPVQHKTEQVNLFVRQPAPELQVEALGAGEIVSVEGESFLRYSGAELAPGTSLVVRASGSAVPPVEPVEASLALAVVVLAAGGWLAFRRRSPASSPV